MIEQFKYGTLKDGSLGENQFECTPIWILILRFCMCVKENSLARGDVEWGKSMCSGETKGDRGDEGYT